MKTLLNVRRRLQKLFPNCFRVIKFQDRLDKLVVRMERFKDGERLFNIPVTTYPILEDYRRTLNLLSRLYDLYSKSHRSIETWLNLPWSRIQIDEIIDSLLDYSNKCRRLPKGLKEWPAYVDLKKTIDDWTEKIVLIELMIKNSLKKRHWEMIERVTNTPMNVDDKDFALKDIVNAPLLKNRDEIEDICQTAIKEIDIEAKLHQIISDWSNINIEFTSFKNRGMLLVKGQELAEVVVTLEESQMIMSSLASNRLELINSGKSEY